MVLREPVHLFFKMRAFILIFLSAVLISRAGATTQSVLVIAPDHTSQIYPYLGENDSNLIVEVYGQPVLLPKTNIISSQVYATAAGPSQVATTATPTSSSTPTIPKTKIDFYKSLLATVNTIFNRWLVACLATLFLIRAWYRFRREGDFQEHRFVFVIYLTLLATLLVIGLGGWGGAYRQAGGLLLVLFYGQLYNNRDLAERRSGIYFWLVVVAVTAVTGAWMGRLIWRHQENPQISCRWLMILGASVSSILPLRYLISHLGITLNEFFNGVQFDMLFSEGSFAQKQKRRDRLPSEILLRHWRENGQVRKAWNKARRNLMDDSTAFPVWLFALETAALHLKKPDTARSLLKRLLKCENISADQKHMAKLTMQKLAVAGRFEFKESDFRTDPVLTKNETPIARAMELRQMGQFKEAENLLLSLVEKEPHSAPVLTQLVRLYAEDFKQLDKAQRWITRAEEHLPAYYVDFLRNSLTDWIKSEVPPVLKPASFGATPPTPADSGKLVLNSYNPPAQPAKTVVEDSLRRQPAKTPPPIPSLDPFAPPRDEIDELVAQRGYGAAAELLQKELKVKPQDFDLWLRYAEVYGLHCGNITGAEKIITQMHRLRVFNAEQMQIAATKLQEWRVKHEVLFNGW